MSIVKITDYMLRRCEKFAGQRMSSSKGLYSLRGESRACKIYKDIVIGALGEMAVNRYIKSKGFDCTSPDFKIYTGRNKSFDADLYVSDEIPLHVKSQGAESVKRYGASWLFQRSDNLTYDPHNTDLLCFTNVNLETREVTILGFCWAKDIVDNNRFAECRVFRYRHTKVALYLKDLEDLTFQF